MNNFIKKVSVIVVCCAVLSMASVVSYAEMARVSYDTTADKHLKTLTNGFGTAKTIVANTRPSVGTSGVLVEIRTTAGRVTASKLFPYQVSVSDLKDICPAYNEREIWVKPNFARERVQGSVSYSMN